MRLPALKNLPGQLRHNSPVLDWRFRTVWWGVIALCVVFWAFVIARIVNLF
jgi:hypothetical protein